MIGIDQEGGKVQRLRAPFTVLPPMAVVGQTGDPEIARRVGRILGTELGAVGINLDFAPVLDLALHEGSVIGDRSFHADPRLVATLALALAEALAAQGVIACGKHFPGHGATARDSHKELPRAELTMAELRATHLLPFLAAIADRLPMLMTAHVLIPAGDPALPASLSPFWVDALLREELGYEGVVITDELGMDAISGQDAIEDTILRLLKTSTDLFLIRDIHAAEDTVAAIHRALASGHTSPERVQRSAERVRALKRSVEGRAHVASSPKSLQALIGAPEDLEFAESLRLEA